MKMKPSDCALGHTAAEQLRLIRQARFLAPATEHFLRNAGVVSGMRVLDIGSGMGGHADLSDVLSIPPARQRNLGWVTARTVIAAIVPLLVAAGTALIGGAPANAHDWYPKECCSNHDCMPADRIGTDIRGGRVVVVGQERIWVPRSFQVRSSPDHQIHICFRVIADPLEGVFAIPLCLFMPPQS
jgi:hypothetical protein